MWCELRFGLLGTPVLFNADAGVETDADANVSAIGYGDSVHPIGSPKVRVLLAALLLEAGRVVSVEALKDALWGDSPPASAHASLHNHVTRLRRLLDDPERLRAVPPGYVLRVDEGELDVHVFESHVAAARTAHAAKDWPVTVRACTAALALWRGTPLSGLPAELGGYAFAQRLAEARLLVLEWRYDAELALGGVRLGALVPELAALVADHPLRESYHRQLMLALHHTGRQAEALAVHRDLRNRLIEELGIEPGAGVRGAHAEVLRGVGVRDGDEGGEVREPWDLPRGAATGWAAGAERAAGVDCVEGAGRIGGTGPIGGTGRAGDVRSTGGADRAGRTEQTDRTGPTGGVGRALAPGIVEVPGQDGAAEATGTADATGVGEVTGVDESVNAPHASAPRAPASEYQASAHHVPDSQAFASGTHDAEAPAHHVPDAQAPASGAHDAETPASHVLDSEAPAPDARDSQTSASNAPYAQAPAPDARQPNTREPLAPVSGAPEPITPETIAPKPSTSNPTKPSTSTPSTLTTPALTTPTPRDQPTPHSPPSLHPPSSPPSPRPAQLPPPPAHFTGRTDTLRALHATLAPLSAAPGTQPLVVISGMAGVGKSALALHAAHALRNRFPDGQLYVNLHGATPGMTPLAVGQALHALLRDLGAEPRHIPEHPDAATALLRSLLAPTRTLMVLDDAENAAQVRPLLPAGPGCAVIVTSRSPLTALDGARRFPLAPLPCEDSAALLRAVSGRDGLDATHPLVELTGRLPLALRVVAARLAARRALTPDVLAGQLAATEGRLHHLEYDDLSVRRSLAVAHDALAASDRETDRDAARTLRHIGALDLPSYGASLLARIADTNERRAAAALDRLVDVALLEETAYGRYTPHDLIRDFARELAQGEPRSAVTNTEPPSATAATEPPGALIETDLAEPALTEPEFTGPTPAEPDPVSTALAWYAAHAERALTAIVEPGLDQDDRRRPTAAQPLDHSTEVAATTPFPRSEDAFAWGDLELENVVVLVTRYHDTSDPGLHRTAHVSTLVRLLFPYVLRSGRVAEMEVLGRAALGAARRLGDAAAEAYALGDLAGLHFLTGRQNEALGLNDQALEIWWRLDEVSWIRRCLNNRGLLLEGLGRYAESGVALRQSLAHSRQLNDPYGEAVTHSHLGNLYEHTDPRAAIEQHRRSLAIGDEIGAVIVQHSAHCNIGYARLTLGEPAAAVPHFEESLRILGGHGDWHGESQTRLGLVRALRLLGRTERADTAQTDTAQAHTAQAHTERAHTECAELLRRADARADRYMGGLARHQLGLLLREQGREQEAYDQWRAALDALDGTDEKAVVQELGELLSQRDAR
ncbi:BTAD domain-containing putative transcriptional regulator [Streptomyces sp. NBC_00989]|uniref:BTAD domain-containing putative transcriptional regulator n=1 Tax=Streptomyces sp. NBC_00989 TaxID=2903705 RepID=UPI0038657CEE|nr:tetratricopeptide repeat protein [Streptomyces sp. NBC_00989]